MSKDKQDSRDSRVLTRMFDLLAELRACKPNDLGELDKVYDAVIIDVQKTIGFFAKWGLQAAAIDQGHDIKHPGIVEGIK